ncbi:ComF family protein [Marinobacter sp. CAU 1620]|nr:ComF family protein [Marinobacter arenosus]
MIKGLNWLSTLMELKVNSDSAAGLCVACLSSNAFNGLCAPCHHDLPANRCHCQICALPLPYTANGLTCGDCLAELPPYGCSVIPWRYQFPVDSMIGRYKYNRQRQFARPLIAGLGQHLADLLNQNTALKPDILVPAPMHRQRRRQRGFNHAQEIAEQIGRTLDIPVAAGLVSRSRNVRSQRELGRHERLDNLRGVFEIHGTLPRRIAIVDDVVTTGATARALAALLRDHGARDIQVWALARTPA